MNHLSNNFEHDEMQAKPLSGVFFSICHCFQNTYLVSKIILGIVSEIILGIRKKHVNGNECRDEKNTNTVVGFGSEIRSI